MKTKPHDELCSTNQKFYKNLTVDELYDALVREIESEYNCSDRERVEKKIQEATMFTDWFSERCFRENYDLVKLILRIALEKEFTIINIETQKFVGNDYKKKEVRFDVLAQDDEGNYHIIEIQNAADGMSFERLEFYDSLFHSKLLGESEKYQRSPKRTIILISKEDIFHLGVCFSRARMRWDDGRICEGSGLTICYFNAECADDSPAGMMMKDWDSDSSDGMCYNEISQPVGFYKKEEKGKAIMFQAFEDYAKQREDALRKEFAVYLKEREDAITKSVMENNIRTLALGSDLSDEMIARLYGLDAAYVNMIRQSAKP